MLRLPREGSLLRIHQAQGFLRAPTLLSRSSLRYGHYLIEDTVPCAAWPSPFRRKILCPPAPGVAGAPANLQCMTRRPGIVRYYSSRYLLFIHELIRQPLFWCSRVSVRCLYVTCRCAVVLPQGYAPGPMQQPNQYHPGFRPPPPPQPVSAAQLPRNCACRSRALQGLLVSEAGGNPGAPQLALGQDT